MQRNCNWKRDFIKLTFNKWIRNEFYTISIYLLNVRFSTLAQVGRFSWIALLHKSLSLVISRFSLASVSVTHIILHTFPPCLLRSTSASTSRYFYISTDPIILLFAFHMSKPPQPTSSTPSGIIIFSALILSCSETPHIHLAIALSAVSHSLFGPKMWYFSKNLIFWPL